MFNSENTEKVWKIRTRVLLKKFFFHHVSHYSDNKMIEYSWNGFDVRYNNSLSELYYRGVCIAKYDAKYCTLFVKSWFDRIQIDGKTGIFNFEDFSCVTLFMSYLIDYISLYVYGLNVNVKGENK